MEMSVTANGAEIPALGLGTWQLRDQNCIDMIQVALDTGYRHIDTAAAYDNEVEVGKGIRAHSLPREQLFLTTKVWHTELRSDNFRRAAEASIERLDVDYVDLLLIHWPTRDVPLSETIGALCKAKRDGLTKHIGVSNFTVPLIEEAVRLSDEPLVTNQVEYHPFLDQSAVLACCRKHGLSLTAYSPLARAGALFANPVIKAMAETYGRTPSQIVLRWHIQQPGLVAIPRSTRPENIISNFQIEGFSLSESDMATISDLSHQEGRMVEPDWAPEWDV